MCIRDSNTILLYSDGDEFRLIKEFFILDSGFTFLFGRGSPSEFIAQCRISLANCTFCRYNFRRLRKINIDVYKRQLPKHT